MKLIYDGLLEEFVGNCIFNAVKEYGHAIEMSSFPPEWEEWQKENLLDYTVQSESCMGVSYSRKTKMYCVVSRREKSEPFFIFFKTQREKDAVVRDFPELVVNASPFKTQL